MVDVTEFKDVAEIPNDILGEIFIKQRQLAEKYVEIEDMGNLLETIKTNLDTKKGQVWIKDFIYRSIEEVGESFEVIRKYRMLFDSHGNNGFDEIPEKLRIHYAEELIDALHFFIEMCIICGYDRKDFKWIFEYGIVHTIESEFDWIDNSYNNFQSRHWIFVESMTLAGNCLRNKKWKETEVFTDRNKFKKYVDESLHRLIFALRCIDLEDADIYNLYFKKNEVNKFRQRSKY